MPYTPKEAKFREYNRGAFARHIEFNLTPEDFDKFWQQPCAYCGTSIETIGIDRVDNSWGYSYYNCVPCCGRCNFMKRALSAEDFISQCQKVASYQF